MINYNQLLKTDDGYKKRILDLSSYVNPVSKQKEIFTREDIAKIHRKNLSRMKTK